MKKALLPCLLSLILLAIGVFDQWYYLIPGLIIPLAYLSSKTRFLPYLFNSGLLSLMAVEMILRFTALVPLHYRSFELLNQKHPEYKSISHLKPNTTIQMTEIGDLAAMLGDEKYQVEKEITTSTDELGFRNSENQKDANNSIVILGDSYALGVGLDQDETISAHLERENYNLGFPGGVNDATYRYFYFKDQIQTQNQHKVIFLFFEGNDYHGGYTSSFKANELSAYESLKRKIESFRNRSAIKQIYKRFLYSDFDPKKKSMISVKDDILYYEEYTQTATKKVFPDSLARKNFSFLKEAVINKGGELIVTIIPSKSSYLTEDQKRIKLKSILRQEGIKVIDLNEEFSLKKLSIKDLWWKDDTHFSPFGAKVTAEVINKALK